MRFIFRLLFGWLFGFLAQRRAAQLARRAADAREIFHYRDGLSKRSIDPLVAWRRYCEDPELDPSIHFDELESDEPELNIHGGLIVANAARRIFDLRPYSETNPAGVTDGEAIGVLRQYMEWANAQKKSTDVKSTPRIYTESGS